MNLSKKGSGDKKKHFHSVHSWFKSLPPETLCTWVQSQSTGVGTGRFFFLILLHTQIELENGFNISQCYETFFISHFSFHTLFPSHLCQMSFKPDWENMNGKEQSTGWGAASPVEGRRGNGCGIIRRAGTPGSIAKWSQKAGKGLGGGKCRKNRHTKITPIKHFINIWKKRNTAMQHIIVFTGC